MPLTLEVMNRVLPAGFPPWQPLTEQERRKAEQLRLRDGGDGPFSRGYFWQKYLTQWLREARSFLSDSLTALPYPHPLLQMAVGYIEVDISIAIEPIEVASRGTPYFFGAVVYDHRGGDEIRRRASRDLGDLVGAAKGIPGVCLAATDILQAPHPAGATATCWAHVRGTVGPIRDIITAKHAVVGIGRGQSVPMASGSSGTLRDFCDGSVDAARVELSVFAGAPTPLAMDIDPGIGLDITFDGAISSLVPGHVTRTWVHPGDSDAYDPQRVFFDVTGVRGDSGALVRSATTGEAVGIYTGIKTTRSTQAGMSQAMWQAAELLTVDLHE